MKLLIFIFLFIPISVFTQTFGVVNACNSTLEVTIIIDGCEASNTRTYTLYKNDSFTCKVGRTDVYLSIEVIEDVEETPSKNKVPEPAYIKMGGKYWIYYPKEKLRKVGLEITIVPPSLVKT